MNYESKAMEKIQVELAQDIFKGIRGHVEEAIIMSIGERWNDIFNAVVAAQPAPAVVSNDKLIEELQSELAVLREEHFQLQATLLGVSCKLPHCPVRALEEAGVLTVDQELSVVEKATEEALAVIANMEPRKSLMEEAMEPMSEIEESFWEPQEDELLGSGMGEEFNEQEHEEYLQSMREDYEITKDVYPEDSVHIEEEEEFDPFASAVVVEEEEEEFDPFAGASVITEDEVHDSLTGDEEFDPFNTDSDDNDMDGIPNFDDNDIPPVPDFEEESQPSQPVVTTSVPAMPKMPLSIPSIPAISPLKKDEVKVVTYQVFDKEVKMVQDNAYIKGVSNHLVKKMAFQLHNVMLLQNDKYKATDEDKNIAKFYTQMVREWGLEIAAANNIEYIKGDSGCAILIAELFYSMHTEKQNLYSPQLRFRNEEERSAAYNSYNMLNNASTRKACMDLVDENKNTFALDPMMFAGDKADTKEKIMQAGYALLHARMSLTWANATGKTVCVFPEVKQENVKKGVFK